MPTPKDNESQSDFIARCIPYVVGEGKDKEQASAMCYSIWKEKGKEGERGGDRGGEHKRPLRKMKSMQGAEIMRQGKWEMSTGEIDITENLFNEMIVNFDNKILEPYINLDHDDKFSNKVNDNFNVVNLGLIEKLYKKGKSLIADFKDVPDKIADLIKSGQLKFKSPEFFRNITRDGKVYHNVLKAISFFGADVPAMDLDDYILIKEKQYNDDKTIKLIKLKTEVNSMEIEKKEYEELIKAKANSDIVEIKMKAVSDTNKLLQEEIVKLKKENKEFNDDKNKVEKMKADIEKEKEDNLTKEAGAYINDIIGKKKLMPKYKDTYVSDYIVKAKAGEDTLKLFKEEIESRGEVINLGSIEIPSIVTKTDAIDFNDNDAIQKAIEVRMKSKSITWTEAHKEIMGEEV